MLLSAALYSAGAHGIMTLNDFKSVEGDRRFGVGSLPVRLGLRVAKGLSNADGARIVAARGEHPYASIEELWRRAGVPVAALTRLAEADAFGSLGLNRRDALWAIIGRLLDNFSPAECRNYLANSGYEFE